MTQQQNRRNFFKSATMASAAVAGLGFVRPQMAAADTSEWITVTATLALDPAKADEAIAGLRTLVKAVQANEPGVLAYICNRGVEDPNEIMFFEIYANQEAARLHGQAPHMAEFGGQAQAGGFFTKPMKIVSYQQIEGYHR